MKWIIVSLLIYFLPLIFVIYQTKWVKSTRRFFQADQRITSLLLFATVSATFVGPGYSIGFIGKGYNYGLLFWLFGMAYALQNILVGIYISPRMRLNSPAISTLGGYFEEKIKSVKVKLLVGFISVGICTGLSAVMLQAGGTLISTYFPPLNNINGILIIGSITLLYTLSGGLKGSISTDVYQFVFFTILILISTIYLLFNYKIEGPNFMNSLVFLTKKGINDFTLIKIISLFLMFLLGETLIPPYVNRIFSSKSPQSAKFGFIYSGIFAFFWFLLMISIGILAYTALNGVKLGSDTEFFALIKNSHPLIKYTVGVTIFGIVMSSLDSLVNSGSISVSQDFFWNKSDKKQLIISRISIVLIIVFSSITALYIKSIIKGLIVFYSIWAPSILPAIIYITLFKKVNKKATMNSIVVGASISILFTFLPYEYDKEFIPFILGLLSSIMTIIFFHIRSNLLLRASTNKV